MVLDFGFGIEETTTGVSLPTVEVSNGWLFGFGALSQRPKGMVSTYVMPSAADAAPFDASICSRAFRHCGVWFVWWRCVKQT